MGNASIFNKEDPILLGNNQEGTLLFQMMLQHFSQCEAMSSQLEIILNSAFSRWQEEPMSPCFGRQLVNVVLSCFIYDVEMASTLI